MLQNFSVPFLQGKDEPLGRSICHPVVRVNPGMEQTPKLLWHPIIRMGHSAGEALMAAELILKDKVYCAKHTGLPYTSIIFD